jgi:hypothetical protein
VLQVAWTHPCVECLSYSAPEIAQPSDHSKTTNPSTVYFTLGNPVRENLTNKFNLSSLTKFLYLSSQAGPVYWSQGPTI